VQSNPEQVKKLFRELQQFDRYKPLPIEKRDIRLANGHDRRVGNYYSIQQQFPAVYGIGELGLPASASALRQAQARQLKAYLLFFDQLLANYFAQLANVKELFSFNSPQPRTYFSQVIDDPSLGLDDIWTDSDPVTRANKLQQITEDSQVTRERKNRFLNHLLARFAEDFTDYSLSRFAHTSEDLIKTKEDLIKAKCAFLQDYRELGAARGRAFNYTYTSSAWDTDNVSGLEKRISRKLGLSSHHRRKLASLNADDEGGFHMVEHLLLRPCPADLEAMKPEREAKSWQAGVLLALPEVPGQPQRKDPYSQQISFIFPDWVMRFQGEFRNFIEQTLREETPAHLHARCLWLNQKDMGAFESAYQDWLSNLGMDAGNTKVRDARDRLIDWLGMGTPYPLRDIELKYDPEVAVGQSTEIHILGAQSGVRYRLCNEDGDPIVDSQGKPFDSHQKDKVVVLTTPAIDKDKSFTILASRESGVRGKLDTPLETYLKEPVSIKAGINTRLTVEFRPTAEQIVKDTQITINYGGTVTVAVKDSQAGISYQLVTASGEPLSASVQGDRKEISLTSQTGCNKDTPIQVKAFRTSDEKNFKYLDRTLSVLVRPNPKVAVTVESSIIDYAAQTTLTLTGVQTSSTEYQLYKRELTHADYGTPVTGDPIEVEKRIKARNYPDGFVLVGVFQEESGKPSISTGSLSEDTLFIVKATKTDNQEALWLTQAQVVLVKPNPAPVVGAKALSVSAQTEGMVTVKDTQKGVMYQLLLDNSTPVNEPGFHWEDRGVETSRVEVDFVVEAPADPEDYKTLLLPTGALTAETTFNVLATKRLTGLSAPLTGTVIISIG
jgi:hypothetical protein